jgi:hypothetical protein
MPSNIFTTLWGMPMTVCLLKAIHWNSSGYLRPAGHRATSGYPKEKGFGHEEWNASPRMRFQEGGIWQRAFHTEKAKGERAASLTSATVFLVASHDKRQDLVGVAGLARHIAGPEHADERKRLRRAIGIDSFWRDAWEVELVRRRFDHSETAFRTEWARQLGHWPTWTCPEDHFLWLDAPAALDAQKLTGKQKLLPRFDGQQWLDVDQALQILDAVAPTDRNSAWLNLRSGLAASDDAKQSDIEEIRKRRGLTKTTRKALIDARLGQGNFRKDLEAVFAHRCAVTGCQTRQVLRASHIRPWRDCSDEQRLCAGNGLLLAAHLDALFDRHLITFMRDGTMITSPDLKEDHDRLGLPMKLLRPLSDEQEHYMRHHRAIFDQGRRP